MAAGLTVDELRQKMEPDLARIYIAARLMITPVAWKSKKYYVLGKVAAKGVYVLDRPITVLEAVARAQGLEAGLLDRNTVEMADLQKSFLMRKGQRVPINFEKLFQEGDLSQNVPIEPDDYLFFPATTLKEVYVLGEVRSPGVMTYASDASVIAAITRSGGFSDRAFKSRVAVIRGSLNKPETFTVDTHSILDARAPDFKLQAKDIVYVHHRPFIKVEELLDLAATAFVQSAAATWAGGSVGPLIRDPIFKPIQ
jgi:protein involved in polysaccharide export with SLBB domain